MVAVVGTYQNGYVKLDKEYSSEKPVKVIVTFLEDIEATSEKALSLSDFSFSTSRKALSGYKGSFSDTVIEGKKKRFMKLFLDTSSLFKLYHHEVESDIIESFFTDHKVTDVFLSELSKVEFASTVWKKVRKQDITELQARAIAGAFEKDYSKYTFVQIDNIIIERAKSLITKYSKHGLRTLDSIQLSTAVMLEGLANMFVSSDKLLDSLLKLESLPTEKPSI